MTNSRLRSYLFFLFLAFHINIHSNSLLSEKNLWLLEQANEARNIYDKPYEDQPEKKVSRVINGQKVTIYRPNHGLAHAARQALLARHLITGLRKDLKKESKLSQWIKNKSPEEIAKLKRKVELAALYYRAGRENEYSHSKGTPERKARFNENMRNGAKMFQKAAQKAKIFESESEIEDYMEAFYRYEYDDLKKELSENSKFIDQILYAVHILDLRRVPSSWNIPETRPMRLKQIAKDLGLSEDIDLIKKLDELSKEFLLATGDRDSWLDRKKYAREFILQARDPERMILRLADVEEGHPNQGSLPIITNAQDKADDKYYSYVKRPLLDSGHNLNPPLDKEILDYIKSRTTQPVQHLAWTLLPPFKDDKDRAFKIKDVVVDRIKDPETGKNYVKLYHGTTSDLVDIFKGGAQEIRFDVADRTALGMGFYVSADMNEAKNYACARVRAKKKENKNENKDLDGLMLVIGVRDDDKIKGKLVEPKTANVRYSDDKTGEPLDEDIYFVRNEKRYNQFLFFKNVAPYLKIFEIVKLPRGFGKSKNYQDFDGLPATSTEPETDKALRCTY
jgi:hypothetical protein